MHVDLRPYISNVCLKSFKRKNHLELHTLVHTGEEQAYECKYYDKRMKQSSAYRHLLNHKGFKTFQCYICDQSFLEKNALVKHSLSYKEDRSDRPFKCSICKDKFSNQLNLEKHSVLHDSKRNFECDMCNYRYLTISYLRQHKENVHNSAISDEK